MSRPCLLVVDDDPGVLEIVQAAFRERGIDVRGAASGEEALTVMERELPDALLLDVRLPRMNGLELFRLLKQREIEVPVILVSSHTSMELAIEAMKEGAFDYLDKPLRLKSLVPLVERALEQHAAEPGDGRVQAPAESGAPATLVGKSPAMLEVYKTIGRVAPASSTILITGESGTGKELVARVIHEKGGRLDEPFQAVNCAAIPEALLESELFGHEKGSFTGADRARPGRFELAGRGTLFLDEVAELPLRLQPKLLRALQERQFDRVGGSGSLPVEARLIAATNRKLDEVVEQGDFREDLFFRLAVVRIHVPALREREGDIRRLTDHFVARLGPEVGRRVDRVAAATYACLEEHHWPGNVRELRNVLERSLLLGRGTLLRPGDLPPLRSADEGSSMPTDLRALSREGTSLEEVERRYIGLVLRETDGNRTRAAEILGVHRTTLHRKIRQLGLGTVGTT